MTQDPAKSPPPRPDSYRSLLLQMVSEFLILARRVIPPIAPDGVRGSGPWEAFIVNVLTYRAALLIGTLFLLGMAGWFAFELKSYTPVLSDDLRSMVYTNEIFNNPGTFNPSSVIVQNMLPLFQHLTYAALVGLFGWGFPLVLVPFLFSLALALVVGYAAYQATGKAWTFPVAALALASMPIFSLQARMLQFHPAVLFFGYGGLVAAIIYLRGGSSKALVGAILGLTGALYSYNIGILFIPVPILYVLIQWGRPTINRLTRLYAGVAVLAIPFVVWHLSVGGLSGFIKQETMWFKDNGYLETRNLEFWGYGSSSPIEFLGKLPGMFDGAAGSLLIPVVVLSIIGLIRLRTGTWPAAVLLSLAIPIATLMYMSPAALPRYVYILLPAMVVLALYGLVGLLRAIPLYKRTFYIAPVVGITLLVVLGIMALGNLRGEINETQRLEASPSQKELAHMADLIDDGKAVLGTSALAIIPYRRSGKLLSITSTAEADFVTYLSWPSEAAVADLFRRHNVGWVLIRRPARRWEVNYNVWLLNAAGQLPQHNLKLETSDQVRRVYTGKAFLLYRVAEGGT